MDEVYPAIFTAPKARPSDPRRDLRVLDLQHLAPKRQKRSRLKWKIGPTVMRDPSVVTGITLHQAAVQWGARPSHYRKAEKIAKELEIPNDERLAIALRVVDDVPAHATAMQSGDVVLRSRLEAFLHHANALNEQSLCLEIEGLYDGVEVVGAHPAPTDLTIYTARRAVVELYERGCEIGMPLQYVWAHRQSSGTRAGDPGSVFWQEVALWAEKELGLKTQPMKTWLSKRSGRGRPIAEVWGGPEGVPYL